MVAEDVSAAQSRDPDAYMSKTQSRSLWSTSGVVVADLLKMARQPRNKKFNELLHFIQHAGISGLPHAVEERGPENA